MAIQPAKSKTKAQSSGGVRDLPAKRNPKAGAQKKEGPMGAMNRSRSFGPGKRQRS